MDPVRQEIWEQFQLFFIGCGVVCVLFSSLLFVQLMAGTGLYFPLTLTEFYLDDNAWSADSQSVKFWVEFPVRGQYEIKVNQAEVNAIGLLDPNPPFEKPEGGYSGYRETMYGLNEVSIFQESPDRKYVIVTAEREMSHLGGILSGSDEYLALVERDTGKIIIETNRVDLIRRMKLKWFGHTTSLKKIETIAWLLLGTGLILLAPSLTHRENRLKKIFIGIIIFICTYGIAYLAYFALYDATRKLS